MALWTLNAYKVLVVDDFADMRTYMRVMLEAYGAADVKLAKNAAQAISALEKERFDLVLCDYNLGRGPDGQQVLEEVRHRSLLPRRSVFVMITAENTADMVMATLECAPDGYLSKPVTKSILQARLRELLDKRDCLVDIYDAMDASELPAALSLCKGHLEQARPHKMAVRHLQTELLFELGEYEQLCDLCESVLDDRDVAWASFMLGRAHYALQRYDAAKEAFIETLELNSDFVTAYDWLARTCVERDESDEALRALCEGVRRSPKSVSRQRALGHLAESLGEQGLTHKAWREVVRIGAHSVHRDAADHTAYARALVSIDRAEEAFDVLRALEKRFPDRGVASVHALVCRATICVDLGRDEEAAAALERALESVDSSNELAPRLAMALIRACLQHRRVETASRFARQLVRNNHGNHDVLAAVVEIYRNAGRADAGTAIVESARDEAAALNNEGVRLLRNGRIDESAKLFADALRTMPRNPVVNLNAAYSLALSMGKGKVSRRRLNEGRGYLETARLADVSSAGYQRVLSLYQALTRVRAS